MITVFNTFEDTIIKKKTYLNFLFTSIILYIFRNQALPLTAHIYI